jgi:hypothetical protein
MTILQQIDTIIYNRFKQEQINYWLCSLVYRVIHAAYRHIAVLASLIILLSQSQLPIRPIQEIADKK